VTNKKRKKGASHLSPKGASHLFLIWAVLLLPAAAQRPADGRILVVPFENAAHEQRLHWLSEASAVLLADELRARGLRAISRDDRVRAFDDLHLPVTATLSRATVIKVGRLVGATDVVMGTVTVDGDKLKIEAHTIRVEAGRLEPAVSDQAPLTDLFASFRRIAARIAPDSRAPAYSSAYPPLNAFESYIKGLIAETPTAQAAFLESAIKLFPGYDRAELALWNVRTGLADHVSALAAAKAVSSSSPLARRARFLAGVSLVQLRRFDEAFAAFKGLTDDGAVADKSVDISAAWNNLGVIQIRRGGTPDTGTPAFFLTKAADASPGDPDVLFNLGYAYMLDRNTQAATYWLRESVRRDPSDADAHFALAAALQNSGSDVEAGRERELARRLSSRYEELERRAAVEKMPVPRGLERMRSDPEIPASGGADVAVSSSAQQDQRELVKFHLDRGQRLYDREADAEALAELQRAVYLSPYEARAHLLIGRIHLRAGRPQDAVNALKISIWSEDTVAARVALADAYLKLQNPIAARGELERALALDPNSAEAKRMLGGIK
jgi:Tfp pilus assembly protein PilF/TolB-like protein